MAGNRWESQATRRVVEDLPRVDVRALVRIARGPRGSRGTRDRRESSEGPWRRDGFTSRGTLCGSELWSLSATIEVDGAGGGLRLSYRSGGVSHAPTVPLVGEAMRFGGVRWWALCPVCRRRCASVFVSGARVACRLCFRLAYRSTREPIHMRAWEGLLRVAKRLGKDGDDGRAYASMGSPPWKPPRMACKKYQRLAARWRLLADRDAGQFARILAAAEGRRAPR